MRRKLSEALNEISDKHITEAAQPRHRKKYVWFSTVAAILALVVIFTAVGNPIIIQAKAISLPQYPKTAIRPDRDDYEVWEEFRADLDALELQDDLEEAQVNAAMTQLQSFFESSTAEFLTGTETENRVFSPMNVYMALAMLAELTAGNSQQQILDLLAVKDSESLGQQTKLLWEAVYHGSSKYYDDKKNVSILANSVWLDDAVTYSQETMDILSENYYASVYQGDLGSRKTDNALRSWLNEQTGGLLKDTTSSLSLSPETVLALASTVYFQAKWTEKFSKVKNTTDVFHSPDGDRPVTYMNKKEMETYYYWGDSYGAIALGLKNDSRMWLILPDEGKTVDDVLSEGQYLEAIMNTDSEDRNSKYMKVNLSLPKFDIHSQPNLKDSLQALGVTDIFNLSASNFSAVTADTPVYIDRVAQAARVAIDEDGVTAASYIVMINAGAAQPPEEIIDFILNRPFLFVISSSDGLPLFAGVVNQP